MSGLLASVRSTWRTGRSASPMLGSAAQARAETDFAAKLSAVDVARKSEVDGETLYRSAKNGSANFVLTSLRLLALGWLGTTQCASPAVKIDSLWYSLGLYVIVFLAGLANVRCGLVEVAQFDGAKRRRIFYRIIWLLGLSTTFFFVILAMVNSWWAFSQIYAMKGEVPTAVLLVPVSIVVLFLQRHIVAGWRVPTARGGRTVEVLLMPRELSLFELLMRRPGIVFARDTIVAAGWGRGASVSPNLLEQYIERLGRKRDSQFGRADFETVLRVGYRLKASRQ